jgi:tRNA threonylcarbamoyladenosine biosynthesis protein TsaB
MILLIKAAGPISELYIYDQGNEVADKTWESGRQLSTRLLPAIEELVTSQGKTLQDLTGIVIFRGPGSFTSLRIGITTANALGYGLNIPVVGTLGVDWLVRGLEKITSAKAGMIVVPEYGAPANITTQKK